MTFGNLKEASVHDDTD